MKKYLVAAVLITAFVTPALAADYYVALRVGGGGCEVMTTASTDTKKYKMMGKYDGQVRWASTAQRPTPRRPWPR